MEELMAYQGQLTLKRLKQYGNFGLGAPDLIDGKLTISDGHLYQTRSDGQTKEAANQLKTPFALVTDFKADSAYAIPGPKDMAALYLEMAHRLPEPNQMYAIRITGFFSAISTRAFPPGAKPSLSPAGIASEHTADL